MATEINTPEQPNRNNHISLVDLQASYYTVAFVVLMLLLFGISPPEGTEQWLASAISIVTPILFVLAICHASLLAANYRRMFPLLILVEGLFAMYLAAEFGPGNTGSVLVVAGGFCVIARGQIEKAKVKRCTVKL